MPRAMAGAALALLAGCATEGHVTSAPGASGSAPRGASWAVVVHGCPLPAQCEELRTSLIGRLAGTGVAERVVLPGRPPNVTQADVTLDVLVTRIRAVSGTERVFFGPLAGRNAVSSEDTLTGPSGTVLRAFTVESASAAQPFSGGSSLSDAYRQFASDTVSALQ